MGSHVVVRHQQNCMIIRSGKGYRATFTMSSETGIAELVKVLLEDRKAREAESKQELAEEREKKEGSR